MGKVVNGVDLDTLQVEESLQELLDKTKDFDDRKLIIERMRQLREVEKAKREALINRLDNIREDNIKQKLKKEAEERQKELSSLAKINQSSEIGGRMQNFTPINDTVSKNDPDSFTSLGAPNLDYMQSGLNERVNTAEERKKKILNQYDSLAKGQRDGKKGTSTSSTSTSIKSLASSRKPLNDDDDSINSNHLKKDSLITKNDSICVQNKSQSTLQVPISEIDNQVKSTNITAKSGNINKMASSGQVVKGISIDSITDDIQLQEMLDQTDDFEERKKIRDRIRAIRDGQKAKREELINRLENVREDNIKAKLRREASERQKEIESLQKIQQSSQIGQRMHSYTPMVDVGPANRPTLNQSPAPSLDYMQEGVNERINDAIERKKKIMSDFDAMAKAPRESKASAFNKFKQMDAANVKASPAGAIKPNITRSGTDVKEMLLKWCRSKTNGYPNVEITNFSSSWSNGLAFCALVHHYFPDAFDFNCLDAKNRRKNFEIAFNTAEEKGDIAPLLDVEDMIMMKDKPDWKCVFTYVQSMYKRLRELD